MDNDFIKLIKCHINALCGKCRAEKERDSVMLRKDVDCTLALHKRFSPQKPICSVHVKTDELSISLKKLGLIIIAALASIAVVKIVHDLCFSIKYRRRF